MCPADPLIPPEATMPRWLRIAREFTFMQRSMTALRPHADVLLEARRSFLAPEDEATIRVWTCDKCGRRWIKRPEHAIVRSVHAYGHDFANRSCKGTVTERVYVDLAAQDPEALVESYNEGGSPDLSELSDRDRRLLSDYTRWLGLGGDDA